MKVPVIFPAAFLQLAASMDHWIHDAAPPESLRSSRSGGSRPNSMSTTRSSRSGGDRGQMTRSQSVPHLENGQRGFFFPRGSRQRS